MTENLFCPKNLQAFEVYQPTRVAKIDAYFTICLFKMTPCTKDDCKSSDVWNFVGPNSCPVIRDQLYLEHPLVFLSCVLVSILLEKNLKHSRI